MAAVCVRCEAMLTTASKTARIAASTPTFWPIGSMACSLSWCISSSGMAWCFPYYKLVDFDERCMREALRLAHEGAGAGEVPVGAVVALSGEILGRGWNAPIARNDPTAHAEILALREAAARLGNYRLEHATLYCTLEPCVMCAGALVSARVERLVFGARDLRFGGVRSKFRIADSEVLNHRVEIIEGVMGAECAELMQRFFS